MTFWASRNCGFVFLLFLFMFNCSFIISALDGDKKEPLLAIINKVRVVSYNTNHHQPSDELSMELGMFSTSQSLINKFKTDGPVCIDLKLANPPLQPSEITQLLPLKEYVWGITSCENTDEHLQVFGNFSQLRWLELWRNQQVTDAGVSGLTNLMHLDTLSLSGANLSLSSFESLSQLPALRVLDISDIQFPQGTKLDLSNFKSLASVEASGSGINPANIINSQNVSLVMKY